MELKNGTTERGFRIIEFNDFYDGTCSIQESSLATEEAIWFGVDDAEPKLMGPNGWENYPIPNEVLLKTRMHLTREQVKALLPTLQTFVETGELPD